MLEKSSFIRLILLYPISLIYGFVVHIRNRMFDYGIILKSKEFSIPVISVGNITVGGTGKTPHIEYLINLLKNECKIATLSRGYKRRSKGFILASQDSTVYDIGDEPKQIKHKFPKIDVAVDVNRVRGINKLLTIGNPELNTILLDDAFQHRYVKPGLSILLIDYTQPMFDDHILPYGRLRESRFEKRRANIIILTKAPETMSPIEKRILMTNLKMFPYQNLYFTKLEYGQLQHLADPNQNEKYNLVKAADGYSVLFLTGIARPGLLREHISKYTRDIHDMTYQDHYTYKSKDIIDIIERFESIPNDKKFIITTEKDFVRLEDVSNYSEIKNLPIFFVPLTIQFTNKDKLEFDKQIVEYVRKNTRNSKLYTVKN